jgi:hypothetical protein
VIFTSRLALAARLRVCWRNRIAACQPVLLGLFENCGLERRKFSRSGRRVAVGFEGFARDGGADGMNADGCAQVVEFDGRKVFEAGLDAQKYGGRVHGHRHWRKLENGAGLVDRASGWIPGRIVQELDWRLIMLLESADWDRSENPGSHLYFWFMHFCGCINRMAGAEARRHLVRGTTTLKVKDADGCAVDIAINKVQITCTQDACRIPHLLNGRPKEPHG